MSKVVQEMHHTSWRYSMYPRTTDSKIGRKENNKILHVENKTAVFRHIMPMHKHIYRFKPYNIQIVVVQVNLLSHEKCPINISVLYTIKSGWTNKRRAGQLADGAGILQKIDLLPGYLGADLRVSGYNPPTDRSWIRCLSEFSVHHHQNIKHVSMLFECAPT